MTKGAILRNADTYTNGSAEPDTPVIDFLLMKDEKWPTLPQDPSWVLEQIEMGFRQIGTPFESPPAVPKMSNDEIDKLVARTLEEELQRLAEEEGEADPSKPAERTPPGTESPK